MLLTLEAGEVKVEIAAAWANANSVGDSNRVHTHTGDTSGPLTVAG